jgi:phosphatidylinositol glycan class W
VLVLAVMVPAMLVPMAAASTALCTCILLFRPAMLPPTDAITLYRSIMMALTCISILAVDFHAFPRRFCKAEEGGIGLMDLGVSSFMFSSALVSRLARSPPPSTPSTPPAQAASSTTSNTASFIRTVLPLYALGLVRFATVTAADYQAHVSEYGVHWNFFLTMAVVTTLMRLLPIRQHHALPVAIALALLHQAALLLGARDYILHAPRSHGFFSANREGIIGSLGYMSIYLSSVAIGARCFALPPPDRMRLLFGIAAASAAAYAVCTRGLGMEVSRRLMNLPYLLLSVAANCFGLALCIMCTYQQQQQQQRSSSPSRIHSAHGSSISQLISQHQLLFFLLCNLATGNPHLHIHNQTTQLFFAKSNRWPSTNMPQPCCTHSPSLSPQVPSISPFAPLPSRLLHPSASL